MIIMQEVLSRPGVFDNPTAEQEYWVLELLDRTESNHPGFVVQQFCGRWSDIDRRFMFDQVETERCSLLIDAEMRYEAQRRRLVGKGLVHSDMEF